MDSLRRDLIYSWFRKQRKIKKKDDMIINIVITIIGLLIIVLCWFVKDPAVKVVSVIGLIAILLFVVFGITLSKMK